MGTRAAFFIGDFRDPNKREWLGCIAFDGYPDGLPEICDAMSEEAFRDAIAKYASERDDFTPPTGAFPFPWNDDLCLTDETYTWHDEQVWCEYSGRMVPLEARLAVESEDEHDALVAKYPKDCDGIPAPGTAYGGSGKDSIMVITA